MSLKVIIKVDTVITAAGRERERESERVRDLPGEWHVPGVVRTAVAQDQDQDHPHTYAVST